MTAEGGRDDGASPAWYAIARSAPAMPAIQATDLDPSRPSPEALLAAAGENRGRLKVFLGAAPGVGKTYEMLTAGRARRKAGRRDDAIPGSSARCTRPRILPGP